MDAWALRGLSLPISGRFHQKSLVLDVKVEILGVGSGRVAREEVQILMP